MGKPSTFVMHRNRSLAVLATCIASALPTDCASAPQKAQQMLSNVRQK